MPAILERCVQKVMEKGHSQQSAFAICRASLDLTKEYSDEEMDVALAPTVNASMGNGASFYKEIVVAHAGRNFVNGDQEFDLTVADMDEMIENFTSHPRQVPILFGGDHALGPERADIPASGWVESLRRDGADLKARCKFMGAAAFAVQNDTFRGVSIGAYQPPDVHGKNVGWRLDHLLITNAPFFSDLNIAARARTSGGPSLLYLAAPKEAPVAENNKKADPAPKADDKTDALTLSEAKEELEAAEMLLKEQQKKIDELSTSNDELAAELKERQKNGDLELAIKENKNLQRQVMAGKIRELIALGVDRGQFKRDMVVGYDGGDDRSDALTLKWFTNSQFKGNMDLLTFALKTFPKTEMRRSFVSGEPTADGGSLYTNEQEKDIEGAGHDPKLLSKMREAKQKAGTKVGSYAEYKRLKAAAQKG